MAGALMAGGMPANNTQPQPAAAPEGDEAQMGMPTGAPDPAMMELFSTTVDYTRQMLAEGAEEVLAAMRVDPVAAAVKFGVRALRTVVQSAEEAGSPLPPEVVLAAGVQTIKDLGAVAEANDLLSEDQDDVFIKEAMQQAIAEFAQLDSDEGLIGEEEMAQLQSAGVPA